MKLKEALIKAKSLIRNSKSNCSLTARKKMSSRLVVMNRLAKEIIKLHMEIGHCELDSEHNCWLCELHKEFK